MLVKVLDVLTKTTAFFPYFVWKSAFLGIHLEEGFMVNKTIFSIIYQQFIIFVLF